MRRKNRGEEEGESNGETRGKRGGKRGWRDERGKGENRKNSKEGD